MRKNDGSKRLVVRLDELSLKDAARVGGKNASLGEMIAALKPKGIRVPSGFATTAEAYWRYVRENQLDEKIKAEIDQLKTSKSLPAVGKALRAMILRGRFPEEVEEAIREAYHALSKRCGVRPLDVAVRSSATAEDLPEASFAGQLETFLNIKGEAELIAACRKCYASLFTDRAIAYREKRGFDQLEIALSIGVQQMVRADKGAAGVMFSLDTESGFPRVVRINAA
jgi:pyruvate,water dikinase